MTDRADSSSARREEELAAEAVANVYAGATSASGTADAAAEEELARGEGVPPTPEGCPIAVRREIKWGAATAAFQIEGAWNEGGRSPSIWDTFNHQPGVVVGDATADVACDHYHKFREDFKLMRAMGIKHYRFSISWSRVLPDGSTGSAVNPEGVAFYDRLLEAMALEGVAPYATMFHWDLPQVLEDRYGGFLGPEFVADFVNYARVLFDRFGDRVKDWMTFNEPWCTCALGYGKGEFAPGVSHGDRGQYLAGHHLLLAHAQTVALYNAEYRGPQGGRIGIVLNTSWHEPLTPGEADVAAAARAVEQDLGWFAGPVYKGDYPDVVKRTKPVPAFTAEQTELFLANKPDFFALNFYTADYVASDGTPYGYRQSYADKEGKPIGPKGQSFWLYVTPWAMRKVLLHVQATYDPPEIWVTENGCSAPGEASVSPAQAVRDAFRVDYYRSYLAELCGAVAEGAKVGAYFAWSALDNFEWRMGYSERFGIVAVDFGDPDRPRAIKDSGRWLSEHFFRVSK